MDTNFGANHTAGVPFGSCLRDATGAVAVNPSAAGGNTFSFSVIGYDLTAIFGAIIFVFSDAAFAVAAFGAN